VRIIVRRLGPNWVWVSLKNWLTNAVSLVFIR
jgi:hypothetical protein